MREILGCPGVRALLQAHDVVAHEVYGEDALRVTPPSSTVNLVNVTGDEVEGPNGECPPVRETPPVNRIQSVRKQAVCSKYLSFHKDDISNIQYQPPCGEVVIYGILKAIQFIFIKTSEPISLSLTEPRVPG